MKRTISALIAFAIALVSLAQATQPCIVKQYNQKQQKTPLGGVQVEVRGAQTATSAANGAVTLHFATLKPGDRVPFRSATKVGFELMNKTAVEQWNISRDQKPFEIVLIQSAYFTQLKGKLKQSSSDIFHEKYEKAKTTLEKLHKEGKMRELEYYQRQNELEDRYDNQLKNLDKYVDQFARIDLSELSEQEQRFVELAHAGRFDEAAEAYNTLNAVGKYIDAVENVRRLNEDIDKLEEEKVRQEETANIFFAMLQRQVNTLELAGGEENYKKAGELLKRAALADTTNLFVVWNYADFAFFQRDFKDAERFLLICLRFSQDNPYLKATIQNNLGYLYSDLHKHTKAEEYYLQAQEIYIRLFNTFPDIYRAGLSDAQNNLGALYWFEKDFARAEKYYLKALENRKLLLAQNPDNYRADLAHTQHNLGVLYWDVHDYAKAEEYYLQALDNKTQLFRQNPDAYREDLAITQNNLGYLYYNLSNYAKAEEYLLQALENRTQLFVKNPFAHRADLSGTQNNLGTLYCTLHDYVKAEDYHLKSLEHLTLLFSQTPDAYRDLLAKTQLNLGNVYYATHNYAKAEEYLLQALENNMILFNQNPNAYRVSLADNQSNLGVLYDGMHDYTKAEDFYLKALKSHSLLFAQNPDAFRERVGITQMNLLQLYGNMENWEKFDSLLDETLKTYEVLASLNPKDQEALELLRRYKESRAKQKTSFDGSLIDAGFSCYEAEDYRKAEEYYLKALENLTLLSAVHPGGYLDEMATVHYCLGLLYSKLDDDAKTEEHYLKALNYYTQLFNHDPETYRAYLAVTQDNLGTYYYVVENITKAEEYYLKAMENRKLLYAQDPDTYGIELVSTANGLGVLYDEDLHDYTKAENCYLNALEVYARIFDQNPDAYRAGLAMTQMNLMLVYGETDQWKKYDELLEKALENYEILAKNNPKYNEKVEGLRKIKQMRVTDQ